MELETNFLIEVPTVNAGLQFQSIQIGISGLKMKEQLTFAHTEADLAFCFLLFVCCKGSIFINSKALCFSKEWLFSSSSVLLAQRSDCHFLVSVHPVCSAQISVYSRTSRRMSSQHSLSPCEMWLLESAVCSVTPQCLNR